MSLRLITPLALTLLLAGCTKKDETLKLFSWSEYVPQAVIDKFTEETGIKVSVENYASNEEMLAKLLAGGGAYDLIQPSEYTIQAMIKEGLLQELDQTKIPNLANIAPEFRNMPFDPGNKYSIPWMAGFVGIVYNAETVTTPIVGFTDVFKPEHAGRIVILDDSREIVTWALATAGIAAAMAVSRQPRRSRSASTRRLMETFPPRSRPVAFPAPRGSCHVSPGPGRGRKRAPGLRRHRRAGR